MSILVLGAVDEACGTSAWRRLEVWNSDRWGLFNDCKRHCIHIKLLRTVVDILGG